MGEKAELELAVEKALCVLGMLTGWEATVSSEARGVAAMGMGRWMRDGDRVAVGLEECAGDTDSGTTAGGRGSTPKEADEIAAGAGSTAVVIV